MEADRIKQEPLSVTEEIEFEDHSNSDLLNPKTQSIHDDLKNYLVKIPNSWKEEPEDEMLDEDIKIASVKQEIFDETESFPGIKMEEVMIKSETENSETGNEGEDVSKKHLKSHIKAVHEKQSSGKFACNLCDYQTHMKRYLRNHVFAKHQEGATKRYSCDCCKFKSNLKSSLLRHMELHDTVSSDVLSCYFCDHVTTMKRYLQNHIRVKHQKNNDNKYACNVCQSKTHKGWLVETQFTCYTCVYKMHNINEDCEKKPTTAKLYSCDHCDFETYYNNHLNKHLLSIHNSRGLEYTCEFCLYRSYLKCNMKAHMRAKHSKGDVKSYACNHCEFKTHYKRSMDRHFITKHKTDLCVDQGEFHTENIQNGLQTIDKTVT